MNWKILTTSFLLAASGIAVKGPSAPAPLSLVLGQGTVIDCPDGVSTISTSNPDAVDVVVATDRDVLVQAKATGQATLMIWSKNGERRVFEAVVERNLEPLRKLLGETFPGEQIDVRATRESLALVGRASSQVVADRALALVTTSVKGAVSNLQVPPPAPTKQILLRVRFAELNRSAATEFSLSLLSTGALRTPGRITTGQFQSGSISELQGGVPASSNSTTKFSMSDLLNVFAFRPDLNLGVLMRDLETRGLLQVLAEPNLVASNGKEATFLAGGEFPVPVLQSGASQGAVTVQFREFGIRLAFLPEYTPSGTLRMHVKPEVSTIDSASGVTISGFRIPALSTRRVETDVELAPGQSFVIAGMLDERVVQDLSRMPGLANIPLLGALFRSHTLNKAKTELVVVVTPESAGPVVGQVAMPPTPIPFLGPPEKSK